MLFDREQTLPVDMNRFLRMLIVLIAFCCAMRLWEYYFVGVHMSIFSLQLFVFCAAYFLRCLCLRKIFLPVAGMRLPVVLLGGILMLSTLTFFRLDSTLAPASIVQFLKGLVDLSLTVTGLAAIICFMSEQPPGFSQRIVQVYILGAAASSFYSFFELGSAYFGHDLGKAIFGRLSTYGPDFDWNRPFYYEWDVFFRAVGFPGVNAQATYTASVIPLLVLAKPFRRPTVNLSLAALCFAGTALTFSRNGFFSLFLCFAFYAVARPAWAARFLPRLAAICIPIVVLALVFSEGARQMISTRLYKSIDDVGVGRREIYGSAWNSIKMHPFGHGINQFSVVVMNTDEIDLTEVAAEYENWSDHRIRQAYANVHNNWLNWLFEGGWPLFVVESAYYFFLLRAAWLTRTALGDAGICSMLALLISGFFNMTLDQFSSSLFFALITTAVVRLAEKKPTEPASKADETAGHIPQATC